MRRNRLFVCMVVGLGSSVLLFAQESARGQFLSPYLVSGPGTVTYGTGLSALHAPLASLENPAVDGVLTRYSLGIHTTGLFGVGTGAGAGFLGGAGASLPTDLGVFTGHIHGTALSGLLPYEAAGWSARARVAFAKALYPRFLAGAAVNLEAGRGDGTDWGAAADIGVFHRLGDWLVFRDAWWDAAVLGLGKGFRWTEAGAYLPETLTPRVGIGTRFPTVGQIDIDLSVDVSFPRFANVRVVTDLDLLISGAITAGIGYSFDLDRYRGGTGSPLPLHASVGYRLVPGNDTVDVAALGSERPPAGLPNEGGHGAFFVNPAHRDLIAVGAGASLPVDRRDRRPLEVTLTAGDDVYFSPGENSPRREVRLPVAVSSPYRIVGYRLVIEDEAGVPVRTTGERAAEGIPVFDREPVSLFGRLLGRRTGYRIPEAFAWDGRDETGETVPDGVYSYYLEVTDETGRVVRSEARRILVDTVSPDVRVSAAYTAFTPGGIGERTTLPIAQNGSIEDEWTGRFLDADRTVVRTFRWTQSEPGHFEWDGRDDDGEPLGDGRYDYEITATDRAGNTTVQRITGLILNTEHYEVMLEPEYPHFSPGTDSPTDEVVFWLEAESPEHVVGWDFSVRGEDQRIVAQREGTGRLPPTIRFDGRGHDGEVLPEGSYRAELAVHYDHGRSAYTQTDPVILDVTPPRASVEPEYRVFSPDGDGRRDTVTFGNETSLESMWILRIEGETGLTVRSEHYFEGVPAEFQWDATDDRGKLVPDGVYTYVLEAVDDAGNPGRSNIVHVEVDTRPTPVEVTTDLRHFSPTGSGIQDALRVQPRVGHREGIARFVLRVLDEDGNAVLTRERRRTAPTAFVWDGRDDNGRLVDDGAYVAEFEILYEKGNHVIERTDPVWIDTEPPEATVELEYLHFAPGETAGKRALRIAQRTSSEVLWAGAVLDDQARVVKTFEWLERAADFEWDGRDEDGRVVPDGTYRYRLYSRDRAGNEREVIIDNIVVDTREVAASAARAGSGFAPTGDGFSDLMVFMLSAEPRNSVWGWTFVIGEAGGGEVTSFDGTGPPPREVVWNGWANDVLAPEGMYRGELAVRYLNGKTARATTGRFLLDVSPPELSLDVGPLPFAPDGDGVRDELTISLGAHDASPVMEWEVTVADPAGTRFIGWGGEGDPPSTIVWDGRSRTGELVQSAADYEIVFAASDTLRNRSETRKTFTTDILVMRDNDVLRIRIASITFAPNTADFLNVAEDRRERNLHTFDLLARELARYPDYQVRIEGHSTMVYWHDEEQGRREHEEILLPLSHARADAVRSALAERGVPEARMDARGVGGAEPIEPFSDTVNNWKNRRVEFILEDR